MHSPVSLDRHPLSTPPPRLPSRSRTATVSPRKEDWIPDDDGYATDDNETPLEKPVDGPVFAIRDALVEPAAEKILTVGELHSLIHEGTIDLNPPYQRDIVWPAQKQSLLIDSLFRNFWIPPVVFAVTMDDDGIPTRVCVDGKQRLTSIQRFLDGQLPFIQSKKLQWYYTTPQSTKNSRLQLPEDRKKEFAAKQITCVEYMALTPEMEREIFQRVQLGMPLTTAEKLAAISSPRAEFISTLESRHISIEGGLSQVLDWDTKRGREFQNVAQFVYCCDDVSAEKVPTAPKMETWLSSADHPGESFKRDIDEALNEFGRIATDPQLNMGFKMTKKLAPVEFVFVGVLIYVLRKATPRERASAISHLRADIRAQFPDIRMNSKVGAALWGLINHLKHNPTISISGAELSSTSSKRKRKMSEDSDYRPSGKNVKTRPQRG
ncbi:hypothetical protein C8R44DRAFT_872833 [Mycena epipterygia]|nr:hypothetical protein C8R44DRAFT_872833 [Mycena epipterygia]